MANQDKFNQPSADLFSTAAVRASQGWKKTIREMQRAVGTSSGGPVSGQADTTEALIADVQTLLDQRQIAGLTSSNPTVSGLGSSGTGESLTGKAKSEEEILQERIFAARMMGAPATVVNNILEKFRTVGGGITSNTSISNTNVNRPSTASTVNRDDVLPKLLQQPSLSPAQQAQARMIAAALFNSYTKSDTAQVTPDISQQPQQVQLSQQQVEQEKPQEKTMMILQQLIKTSQQNQQQSTVTPPEQQVQFQQQKKQQQQIPALMDLHNKTLHSRPQKWSNRPQSTKINPTEPVNSGSSTWQAKLNAGIQSAQLQQQQPQLQQSLSAAAPLQHLQQIPPKANIGLQNVVQSTQSPVVQYVKVVKEPKQPVKALQQMKMPPFPDSQPSKSNEVLQSLRDDGYIGSPNRIGKTINSAKPEPGSNVMDFNSTIWPGTLGDDMKSSQHGMGTKPLMSNDLGSKRPIAGAPKASKVAEGLHRKQMPKPQQSNYSTGGFPQGVAAPAKTSTWHASVDAFLQSTKRGAEDTSRKRPLQSNAPVSGTPTITGFFSNQQASEIPFLSDVEPDQTISSIDQRVEMLKQQKAQILQDQMEEFYKEINYGEGTADSEPVAKQRKTSSQKGPSSSEKEKGGTRPRERERSRDRGDRDREKRRDEDRNRRTTTRSPPRKRHSREMETKSRSQSSHRDLGKRKDDVKSPPSPKRSRSGSLEKTKREPSKDSSSKDIDKRQGRYPSSDQLASPSASESRTSRSPERKRPKSDGKPGEVFVDGRWQRSVSKPSGSSRKDDHSLGHDGKRDQEAKKKSDARKEEKERVSSKTSEKEQSKDSTALKTKEKNERSKSSGKTEDKKHVTSKDKKESSAGSKKSDKGRSETRSEKRDKEKKDTSTKTKERSTGDSKTEDDAAPVDKGPEEPKLEVSTPKTDSTSSSVASPGLEAGDQPASSSASSEQRSASDDTTKASLSQSSALSSSTGTSLPKRETSDKGGRSLKSTSQGMSPAGDKPKQQKQEEETPTVVEESEVTASVKESPVAGVGKNSISHQMGLLRSLSIEEYVSDKVMVNWFCYLCGAICHSMKLYMSHVKGRKHKILYSRLRQTQHAALKKKLISKLKRLPTKSGSGDTALQGTIFGSAVKKMEKCTLKAAPSGGPPKDVCSRCFRPYSCSYEEHLRSEEHKKFEGIRPRCNVCDMIFQKIQQYRKHLATPAHRKKVAASRKPKSGVKAQTPRAEIKPSDTSAEVKKTVQPNPNVIGSEFITPISGFFCKLCSKFYNNEKTARDVHCATPLHIAKTHQYYASRNQSPGTGLIASQGATQDSGDASTFSGENTKRDADSLKVMPSGTEAADSASTESSSRTSTLAVKTSSEENAGKPVDAPMPTPKVATSQKPVPEMESPVGAALPETKPAPNVPSSQTSTPNTALPKDNMPAEMKLAPEVAISQKATPKTNEPASKLVTRRKQAPSEDELDVSKTTALKSTTPKETEEAIPKIATLDRNITKQTSSTSAPVTTALISKECEPKEVERRVTPMRTRSQRVTAVDDAFEKTRAATPKKTRSSYSRETSATSKEPSIDTQCPAQVETNSLKEALPENVVDDVPMEVSQNYTIEETPMDSGYKRNTSSEEAPSKEATPKDATPKKATPKEAAAKEATPKKSTPKEASPKVAISKESVLKEAAPKEAAPKEATPKEATPKEATPKEATPKEAAPKEAAPKEAAPKEAAPKKAAPKEAAPKEATPKKATPKEAAPKEAAPKETAPKETTPKEAAPKKPAPKEITPKETIPKETTPKEATLKEALPKEASPKEASPKEASPKEASPKETTPKEGAPKTALPKKAKPKEALPKAVPPNEASSKEVASKEVAPNEVKAIEISSKKATSIEAIQEVATTQKTERKEAIPIKATSKDATPQKAKQQEVKQEDVPKETTPKDAKSKEDLPKKDTCNDDPPRPVKEQTGKIDSSDEMPLKKPAPKETKLNQTESSNQTPVRISSVPIAPSSSAPAASTMTVTSTATPSPSRRRTTRSMHTQGKASVTAELKSVSSQKQVSEKTPSEDNADTSPSRTTLSSDKSKVISQSDPKKPAITETSKKAHGTEGIDSDVIVMSVKISKNATETPSAKNDAQKGVNAQKTKTDNPVQKEPSAASVTHTSAESPTCQRNQTAAMSIGDSIPVNTPIKTEKDPEPVKSTSPSSQPKDVRDDESKSPRIKPRSTSPRASTPMDVVDDDSRGAEYFDIDEFMSDDIIVIDEDSGHEMGGSDEEDITIDLIGEVSGDVSIEEQVLGDKWIVEDVDMEEGGEEGFEMPDMGDMFAIDEVGGSDDEEEGLEGHDVHQIEEWEVLSEAEDD